MRRKHAPVKRKQTQRKHHYQKCMGKIRYRDQQEARAALHRLAASQRDTVPSRSYSCHECNGWHLTSKADRYAS